MAKIPISPKTGRGASASDPATWGTYDEAQDAIDRFGADGLGFELGSVFSGYIFIDLDDVIDNGNLKPFVVDIVNRLNSYTERSPSGRGLHILCRSSQGMTDLFGPNPRHRNDGIGLEMYDSKRFFTITGSPYGEIQSIRDCTQEVKIVYDKYLQQRTSSVTTPTMPITTASQVTPPPRPLQTSLPPSPTDETLLKKMFNSQKGQDIKKLWDGDFSDFPSHSEADMALINHLAYWTREDAVRIDKLFRQSRLMRPKWDEGNPTYGQRTISKVLTTSLTASSVPSSPPAASPTDYAPPPARLLQPSSGRWLESNLDYLNSAFAQDFVKIQRLGKLKTGFSNIDVQTSLYPGLYLLGALPSLGKTTFCVQLADQLAQANQPVLYFTLEQSRFELVMKSLSRLTTYGNGDRGVSATLLRERDLSDPIMVAVLSKYKAFAMNILFIERRLASTMEAITNQVEGYIRETGNTPVVIVDYLQFLQADVRQTAKDAVDSHVQAFKKLQAENDLVVILISSFNRQNYLTSVGFDSFKESGGLEYTADVIWGLQLQVMNELDVGKMTVAEKRAQIRLAKGKHPRRIELVCLKNRFGEANVSVFFDYYAMWDLFVPTAGPASLGVGTSLIPTI